MDKQQTINSTPPAAPKRWPVIDLVELTASLEAYLPKVFLIANVSILSFKAVEVPWALI